jgi:GT2 family glycosyltransferase
VTTVSCVVLAYGEEPWLERAVTALLASEGVEVDVIVVDNGCTGDAVDRLCSRPGVTVFRPGTNLGFPGGCNAGAAEATGEVLAFINSDAVVCPTALLHLAGVALRPEVGIATASLRLGGAVDRLNSGGNEIHFLALSWSGCFGEPAEWYRAEREVAGSSGAAMAIARAVWERIGGFEATYFLYHEDAELSLRCWQQGLSVVYVPEAVVVHHYEFSRNPRKFYLIERNRLILLLTLFERRALILVAPALVVLEIAMLGLAVRQGWFRDKLAGWAWILRNWRWVRNRRREVQQARTRSDRELSARFASEVNPGNFSVGRWIDPVNRVLAAYWRIVRRLL